MITPLAINTLITPSNTGKTVNNNNHSLTQKVGKAWQEKSLPSTETINKSISSSELTDTEKEEVNKLLAQLKVNDMNGDTSVESHRENFLVIYKKLIHISKDEKATLIANTQKMLNTPDIYDNQELLSKTFKRAIYRYNAIALMNQPLVNQMNDQINNISLDGENEEEEYKFY
ncbi:hypothetical protein AHYW_000163 [Providencia manganoxydans]|uniref:hypothetical protein n=1 Tax=Providencia TaxID=586 RepID=UPI001120754C|nr:hypothetical protein [Providencia stuartii]